MAMMCAEPAAGFARQASNLMPRMGHRSMWCRKRKVLEPHACTVQGVDQPFRASAGRQHAAMSSSEQPEGEGEAFIGQTEGQLDGDVLADLEGQQNPDGEHMPAMPGLAARVCSCFCTSS